MKIIAVYLLTNKNHTVLYTGVTSHLGKRITEHKLGLYPGSFSHKYNVRKLVWFNEFRDINEAIIYEKKVKNFNRCKKKQLINSINPLRVDLSEGL